ncbi:hypothetical protein IE81DRAFT_4273 [Ceraceosorus guamensis]|uniref:SWI5-dependent HO expression protein 3 n=1 Tax=Ceraceosorus guamensis TaxID=1522189 RepID=A0A316W8R9_9BASI|nr:hypothetical protein IE81DRAFT_4273 [Ceraceosorus guamensis]PWN46316.1 hypothetical protein IE81DRAFT_4273 [Ceraceosorus guamensis]
MRSSSARQLRIYSPTRPRRSQLAHKVLAVQAASKVLMTSFLHSNFPPSTSAPSSHSTITEMLALSEIDAVLVATSNQSQRGDQAATALRAGKAVLLPKPLGVSAAEAKELCALATKNRAWLAMPMSDGTTLVHAADHCSQGVQGKISETPALAWSQSLAVLEILDDLRIQGNLPAPPDQPPEEPAEPLHSAKTTSARSIAVPGSAGAVAFPRDETSSKGDDETCLSGPRSAPLQTNRPSSRLSTTSETSVASGSASHGDASADRGALRAQVQEMKHIIRQQKGVIATLEQKAGLQSGASSSWAAPSKYKGAQGSGVGMGTPPSAYSRLRVVSGASDRDGVTSDREGVRSASPAGSISSVGRRRRRDSGTATKMDPAVVPAGGANQLGLAAVKEAGPSNLALGEGFLAPTIASENRRLASTNGASTDSAQSSNGIVGGTAAGGSSGKVIQQLTSELAAARSALEETKVQLRASQKSQAATQRSWDETKAALNRSRAENENSGSMLTRKDRQASEALERARKAEKEAKELGKASREWGSRVREVEAELGEERRRKQKTEASYEALTSAWKTMRETWEKELGGLRKQLKDQIADNAAQAKKMTDTFDEAKQAWLGRESERQSLDTTLTRLQEEREKAKEIVTRQVEELVKQLVEHEKHTGSQDAIVEECASAVRRMIRLARANDTTTPF